MDLSCTQFGGVRTKVIRPQADFFRIGAVRLKKAARVPP
jgi:hypothetical protein